jgi:aldehyde dehydrogenase (NAD+)
LQIELIREPVGVVLVIGPSNYPFFLAGVQCIQALVAGNGVLLKPGRGGSRVLHAFRDVAIESGVPPSLFCVLDESVDAGVAAIRQGVDKIVMTGTLHAGRAVLAEASKNVTPCIVELAGDDSVFILEGADLTRAAQAVTFGVKLNGGDTCICPRRVFVLRKYEARFRELLSSAGTFENVAVIPVGDEEEALAMISRSEYGLGGVVFGEPFRARAVAERITAGVVVINDVIVPTADPRVPFGGRKLSGFGCTRGEEGLLELTALKAVITQNAKRLWHLEPQPENALDLFLAFLGAAHRRSWKQRMRGLGSLVRLASNTQRKRS